MENKLYLDKQIKKLSDLLRNEQDKLRLTQYEMAIRLDMSETQYKNLIRGIHGNQGYTMDTLNKIFDNTNIVCCDIFME